MKIVQDLMPILTPDEGCLLTNGEIYSDMVFLGTLDSPSNWHDIKIEEVPPNEYSQENSLFN
jgi:hypothetical protein